MIPKPKFSFEDTVEFIVSGEIDGEKVSVKRTGDIRGIDLEVTTECYTNIYRYFYKIHSYFSGARKEYLRKEDEIVKVSEK